jgi:uncharacterized membrane protein YphA (DoxX/SURF4 family)
MCKLTTLISSILLGAIFIIFGLNFFFHFIPIDSPAEGSNAAAFMGVLYTTGYLGLVKALEVIGGVLVILPKTRNLGLLILVPIIVNIIAYNVYITKDGFHMDIALVSVLALYLLFKERSAFVQLLGNRGCCSKETSENENNSCSI